MRHTATARSIKLFRELRHWSQEELATASGVDVRTIQRAEAGRPLELETLKALAAAFDVTVEVLQIPEEDIHAFAEEFRKSHTVIKMHVVNRSDELGSLIGSAEALFLHRIGELNEKQLDQVAGFQGIVRDYLDIWTDIGATGQREAETDLYRALASLLESNMSVSFGLESMPMQMQSGEPFRMSVLYIAVTPGAVPMLALVRPNDMAIAF